MLKICIFLSIYIFLLIFLLLLILLLYYINKENMKFILIEN